MERQRATSVFFVYSYEDVIQFNVEEILGIEVSYAVRKK